MHKVNPHTKLCFGIIVLCLLNIITSIKLSQKIARAESSSATASVTVPEACTMTSHNDTPHTATLSPNTYSGASGSEYENGIGKTTLTATCNDDNGFSIYAIGYTGNSYDSENHNKLVGQSTNVAINTAVYTSGDTASSWSMKVNKINDSTVSYNPQNMSILDSFDSWHIVPATYTKVAEYHASTGSSTTDTTLGAKVETTYAAYIASNQPADTYIGQVKYTMVHPYNETAPIVCAPSGTTISTITCMQDITSANKTTILESMTEGQAYSLIDIRDLETYRIAKFKDGGIWMLDNLRLDPTNQKTAANMTNLNTNATSEAISNYINGGNIDGITGWSTQPVENVTSFDQLNGASHPQIATGFTKNNTSYTKDSIIPTIGGGSSKLGVYYNFCAISIGTACQKPYLAMSNDICPLGWHVPTWSEYSAIYGWYGGQYPPDNIPIGQRLEIPLTTEFWSTPPSINGGYGYLWTSSPIHDGDAFYIVANSNPYISERNTYKYSGIPVRCRVQ